MSQTCSNVLMGGATVWYAPQGEAYPDETTVDFGADWGGNWTEAGLTNAPLTFGVTTNLASAMVEQRVRPVRRRVTSMEEVFEGQLAEITATNFSLLVNGTTTTVSAGTSQKGYEQFDVSANDFSLTQRSWGFEGENIDSNGNSQPVRFFVDAGESVMNGNLEMSREGEGWGLPFQVLVDDTCSSTRKPWSFQKVTAPATS